MATLLLNRTSSQVITSTLYTHVPGTDQRLVPGTACTYPTTLQASKIPTPHVIALSLHPMDILGLVPTAIIM